MGLFSAIMDKLRGHAQAGASNAPQAGGGSPSAQQSQFNNTGGAQQGSGSSQAQAPAGGQAATMQNVDVEAVLTKLANDKGGGGNWRTSIVDLLKLLDLDSSMNARKELAQEMNVHVGADGSAEQNIALHKAVMRKLAENGGKVPDSMRH